MFDRLLGYPFWQPLVWFSAPFPKFFDNSTFSFLVKPDTLISILAIAGLPRLYRRQPFYFIWLVTGLVLLLQWPTKWPQYTMIMMVPYCLSAAMGTGWLFDLLKYGMASWRNRTQTATSMPGTD